MSNDHVTRYLDETPMRAIVNIPMEVLDQAMATAYQLYRAGRLAEAQVLCTGLLAADHRYWWAYGLSAAILRRAGRLTEALQQIDRGLRYEPGQPKLLATRAALTAAIAAAGEGTTRTKGPLVTKANPTAPVSPSGAEVR